MFNEAIAGSPKTEREKRVEKLIKAKYEELEQKWLGLDETKIEAAYVKGGMWALEWALSLL